MNKLLIALITLVLPGSALAKSFSTFGAMPLLSMSKGLGPKYDLSFQHYDTFNFTDKKFEGKHYPSRDQLGYFQTSLAYKLSPDLNFALGHIYQRSNPLEADFTNEHRIFEQVTLARRSGAMTFTHRLRFEQRFIDERKDHEFKTRLRYQIGANFPLDGRQLDPGEFYFNCYNEFYFSTTGERNAFFSDDWMYAGLGYQTHTLGKFEAGPMGQFSVVNRDKDIRNFYLLQMSWILKFK